MDWNVFVSSVAQSSASLIGILGAFLVSRVLNENDTNNRIRYEFRDIAFKRTDILEKLKNTDFDEYNENTILQSQGFWDELLKSEYESNDDAETKAERCLIYVQGLYNSPKNLKFAKRLVLRNVSENEFEYLGVISPVYKVSFDELQNTKMNIDWLRHESKVLMRKYGIIKNDIAKAEERLKTIRYIIILLLFSSLFSVCLPLLMLPLKGSKLHILDAFSGNSLWFRIIFVAIVFLVVMTLAIILLGSIKKIKNVYKDILNKITDKHINLHGYSSYFKAK